MQSADPSNEAEIALYELRRLVHGIRTASYAAERSCGVTGAQLFVLRELAEEPGISIRRLSERTMTDPSSVSVLVARLVERGLMARSFDTADRRKSVLDLTKKGSQLLARAPEPYQSRVIEVLRSLPPAELGVLQGALGRLADALGTDEGAPLFFEDEKQSVKAHG